MLFSSGWRIHGQAKQVSSSLLICSVLVSFATTAEEVREPREGTRPALPMPLVPLLCAPACTAMLQPGLITLQRAGAAGHRRAQQEEKQHSCVPMAPVQALVSANSKDPAVLTVLHVPGRWGSHVSSTKSVSSPLQEDFYFFFFP